MTTKNKNRKSKRLYTRKVVVVLQKVAHRVAFFDCLKGGDGHWVKSKTKDVCE